MKSTFAAFPEVLVINATYQLAGLRMPVYLMMVVDGNGQSEIVCVFVTVLETEESMIKMVEFFKLQITQYNLGLLKSFNLRQGLQ